MNMMAIQHDDDIIIIDAGLMFPSPHMLGIKKVIPDFTYLNKHKDQIRGLFLTHGHEDHIGALPDLFLDMTIPLYGSEFTLTYAKERLRYRQLWRTADFHVMDQHQPVTVGSITVTPFHVCHSIPGSFGLVIDTPSGRVIHTGDLRLDEHPIDGKVLDMDWLSARGKEGVLALLSDSTNSGVEGRVLSESVVGETYQSTFSDTTGRIIVVIFSSHIHRIQQVVDMAKQTGRRIFIAGDAIRTSVKLSKALGYLDFPDDLRITTQEVRHLDPDKVVILATGSQGEPHSVLDQLSRKGYRGLKLRPGDKVVFSARIIPGNERYVHQLMNQLLRKGATLCVNKDNNKVHVSGHGYQDDLKLIYECVKPHYYIPVHGEYRHLLSLSQLAQGWGMSEDRILLGGNGDCLVFEKGDLVDKQQVPADPICVDGRARVLQRDRVQDERRDLSRKGVVTLYAVIHVQKKLMLEAPLIVTKGVFYRHERHLEQVLNDYGTVYYQLNRFQDCQTLADIQLRLCKDMSEWVFEQTGRHPYVIPIFKDMSSVT